MGQIFAFGEIQKSELAIKKTWSEFRDALANGDFTYDEVDKAKQSIFLKAYDDLFHQNSGIEHETTYVKDIKSKIMGRGTILRDAEVPDYGRFIPKKEFMTSENRFSPPGIEWLYLAMGAEIDIHKCTQAECRAKKGQRFGFCHFQFDDKWDDMKLVDLTIADNISYSELNQQLEDYGKKQVKKGIKTAKALGYIPKRNVNQMEFKKIFTQWGVYTYAKLLSEQIFVPLSEKDDKSIMYAPFQTMAQYYISLGYLGIIYGSTVCNVGKNIVLFDKNIATPVGDIEDYILS